MTSLQPRGPYSQAELEKLYPKSLRLELVQVLLRHGERSPVSARFQNVGQISSRDRPLADRRIGRSCTLLAVLQCSSALALRGYDPYRHFEVEFSTMASAAGEVRRG